MAIEDGELARRGLEENPTAAESDIYETAIIFSAGAYRCGRRAEPGSSGFASECGDGT